MDMAGLTGLENFNIDLRTGRVTAGDTPGGRISPDGQAAIEQGLKPQGPLGGDQRIDVGGIQNQTTQIDAQGQTTVMDGQVWGDVNPNMGGAKTPKPGRKPKEGLKPLWDLFDLKPEKGLIFSNIKTEEEFEFIFLDLKDKEEDGKSDTT